MRTHFAGKGEDRRFKIQDSRFKVQGSRFKWLLLMDEQDRLRQAKLAELRREVREGLDSGPSEPWGAAILKKKACGRQAVKSSAT